jgi:hypothetical protein
MLLYYTFINFLILFFSQIFVFKILKIKKNWHLISLSLFFIIFFLLNSNYIFSINFLNYLVFNLTILISYMIFLTLVFNESPSLYYLEKKDLNNFLKKGFVKHRVNLMIKDKLINKKKKITKKGLNLLKISTLLSNIFLEKMINFLIFNIVSMIFINFLKINSIKKIVFFIILNYFMIFNLSRNIFELIEYSIFLISILNIHWN